VARDQDDAERSAKWILRSKRLGG